MWFWIGLAALYVILSVIYGVLCAALVRRRRELDELLRESYARLGERRDHTA